MYVYFGKNRSLATDALSHYNDLHQDLFWYLLQQTEVNCIVGINSLREFLIRYLLITERPLHETAEEFINEGLLISGTMGDQAFAFFTKDLFPFFGFAATSARYLVHSSLDEFVKNYQNKKYIIRIDPEEEGATKISHDVLTLALSGLGTLIQIDSLNLRFREDLNQVTAEEVDQVSSFVNYVLQQILSEAFTTYQSQFATQLSYFTEYYQPREEVNFDPWTQLPKASLISLFEYLLGSDHHLVQDFRDAENPDEDVLHDLQFQIPYIKFAYGVKHGYITLDDNWHTPLLENYSPELNLYPAEELSGEDGEVYSTNSIYEGYRMEEWIHLLP